MIVIVKHGASSVYIGTPQWVVSRTWVFQPGRCEQLIRKHRRFRGQILGELDGDDLKAEEIRRMFGASWERDPLGSVLITPELLRWIATHARPWKEVEPRPKPQPALRTGLADRLKRRKTTA
jgi:hypothetical protein